MDAQTQKGLDALVEHELARGYRVKPIPEHLQAQCKADGIPVIARVRFTRLNMAKRKKIAEAVTKRYYRDLEDSEQRSYKQILALVEARGEWSPAMQAELEELMISTRRAQDELFLDGIADNDWQQSLIEAAARFRMYVTELEAEDGADLARLAQVTSRFDRWVEYLPERKALYTERFAKEQGLEEYSPDRDMSWLLDHCPHQLAVETLEEIEDLRSKLLRFLDLSRDRMKLRDLQERHAKIFAESIETRRDASEEMARLYFCAERVDENGAPLGRLMPTFDEMWEIPEDLIQWLLVENYFFLNGIPDEARQYLETFGFLRADRESETPTEDVKYVPSDDAEATSGTGDSAPSVESPAPPTSKGASTPAVTTAASSLESPAATS